MDNGNIKLLNEIIAENASIMFGVELAPKAEVIQNNKPFPVKELTASLGVGGPGWQGQVVLSMDHGVALKVFEIPLTFLDTEEEKEELLVASFGELANVVSGTYMAHEKLSNLYGILDLAPPMYWDIRNCREPFFCKSDGASGMLTLEGDEEAIIYSYFSLSPLMRVDLAQSTCGTEDVLDELNSLFENF